MFLRSLRHGTLHRLEFLSDYQRPSLRLTHAVRCQLPFALQCPQHSSSLFACSQIAARTMLYKRAQPLVHAHGAYCDMHFEHALKGCRVCSTRLSERQRSPTDPTTETITTAWLKPSLQCTCWPAPTSSTVSMEMARISLLSSLTPSMILLTGTPHYKAQLRLCTASPPDLLTPSRTPSCMTGWA